MGTIYLKFFFSLQAMNLNGELKTFSKDEIKFSYRRSDFGDNLIILNVVLQGKNGNKDDIKKNQEQLTKKKTKST